MISLNVIILDKQRCHSVKMKNLGWDNEKSPRNPKVNVSHQTFETF